MDRKVPLTQQPSQEMEDLPLSQETFHDLWCALQDNVTGGAIVQEPVQENQVEIQMNPYIPDRNSMPSIPSHPSMPSLPNKPCEDSLNSSLSPQVVPSQSIGPNKTSSTSYTSATESATSLSLSFSPSPNNQRLPSNVDYPGEYDFQISLGQPTSWAAKSVTWTYSPMLKKLFVDRDKPCPIQFKTARAPPPSTYIRVLPIFRQAEHLAEIVARCPNHVGPPDEISRDHVVLCSDPSTVYYTDISSGRPSLLVPYVPPAGTEYSKYLFIFKCFISCVGGLNRRKIQLIFTLENEGGNIIGRQVLDVRVCACPGRDRRMEEKAFERPKVPQKKPLKRAEPPTFPSSSVTENKGKTSQLWSKSIQSTSSMGETDPHDQGGVAVHWEFITDAPDDFILQEDEAEIACGIRFSPSGATFKEPVKVTMEHCAHFTDPSQAEIVFYTRSKGMTSFERIPASTKGYPRCDVRTKDLDLYVDHFCQWRIATKFNEYFKGKRVKCTPYVKPPVIKGRMHVVVLYIYDNLSEIKMKVEEEMTGYEKLHPPKSLYVAWRSGDVVIKLFEGPRRHRTLVDEKLMREQNFYQVSCDPQSFLVEPPIGEANQKPLQFVLGQSNPKSTDEEILIVLTYADRASVQPLSPPSPPQSHSQSPSSSSSSSPSPLPLPSQPLSPPSLRPSSSSASSPSSVSQGELIKLAEDVPTRKYTELCNNMGFGPASSEQVLTKHSKDYKQALIEILCSWDVSQETGNSRMHLADILQKTCLQALAAKLKTGHYLSTFDFDECEEPSGAESKHERDDSAQYPQTSGTRQQQKRMKGSSKGPGKKKSKR